MTGFEDSLNLQAPIDRAVATRGVFVLSVASAIGQAPIVPYAYTIGLSARGAPEILVSGAMHPRIQHGLLTEMARPTLEGTPAWPQNTPFQISPGANAPVMLRALRADAAASHLLQAQGWANRHGHTLGPALMLVLGDVAGRFPWDADYNYLPVEPLWAPDTAPAMA